MDQTIKHPTRPLPLPPPADLDAVMEVANPAIAAAMSFQSNLIESLTASQKEWFGFLSRRLQENIEMPVRLSRCRSPIDVQKVYLEYWTHAAFQYSTEFAQLRSLAHTPAHRAPGVPTPRTMFNGTLSPPQEYRPSP